MGSTPNVTNSRPKPGSPPATGADHGRIASITDTDECLDTDQLEQLEQSFRRWAKETPRADVAFSRRRILLIFLLIRYTGAKLNEVLALNPHNDMDSKKNTVVFGNSPTGLKADSREVHLSQTLFLEITGMLSDPLFREYLPGSVDADPGFVRRKFYERARACGFPKQLGGPESIRKARAVELIQNNMPLPAVQMILGHSTPDRTSAYVSFSREEIQHVARRFMEKESMRRSSARNSFFGRIIRIVRGDIQAVVQLTAMEGFIISAVVTSASLERLGLKTGRLITAEVKAPMVMLQAGVEQPSCSAENILKGTVEQVNPGRINTECVIRLSETTSLCALVSSVKYRRLNIRPGDEIWAFFTAFSVVLHVE